MPGNGDRGVNAQQRAALSVLMANRTLPRIAAMSALTLCLCLCLGLASAQPRDDADYVFDGDTIRLEGDIIRLFGIDAPEGKQTCRAANGGNWDCGAAATTSLRLALGDGRPDCDDRGRDIYHRRLAVCRVGGVDINDWLVREGFAWSFRRYSGLYNKAEEEARGARRGVWQARTETPWSYRARMRRVEGEW